MTPRPCCRTTPSVYFAEDQAGYLAGIVAAYASKNNTIGAIGGTTLCAPCVRYIQGYELGAKSVKPDIKVKTAYVTNDFSAAAFNDPAGGKAFAETFIKTNKPDVLFQVAGKTGNGVLEAACAAKIYGIGVDVDQWVSLGAPGNACIITSAEKQLVKAVSAAIVGIAGRHPRRRRRPLQRRQRRHRRVRLPRRGQHVRPRGPGGPGHGARRR